MRNRDVLPPPRRQCPGCERTLLVTEEHFHRDSLCADGFTRRCAACRNEAERQRYALEAPERARRVRERRQRRAAYFESTGRYEAA